MIFRHISLSLSLKTHYLLKVLFLLPDRKLSPNLLKWNVPLNKCPDKDSCWLHSGRLREFLLRLREGGAIYLLLIVQSVLINIQFHLLLLEIKKKNHYLENYGPILLTHCTSATWVLNVKKKSTIGIYKANGVTTLLVRVRQRDIFATDPYVCICISGSCFLKVQNIGSRIFKLNT